MDEHWKVGDSARLVLPEGMMCGSGQTATVPDTSGRCVCVWNPSSGLPSSTGFRPSLPVFWPAFGHDCSVRLSAWRKLWGSAGLAAVFGDEALHLRVGQARAPGDPEAQPLEERGPPKTRLAFAEQAPWWKLSRTPEM